MLAVLDFVFFGLFPVDFCLCFFPGLLGAAFFLETLDDLICGLGEFRSMLETLFCGLGEMSLSLLVDLLAGLGETSESELEVLFAGIWASIRSALVPEDFFCDFERLALEDLLFGFEEELCLFKIGVALSVLVDLCFGFTLDVLFLFPLLALGCSSVVAVAFISCRTFSKSPLNELDLFTTLWDGAIFLS